MHPTRRHPLWKTLWVPVSPSESGPTQQGRASRWVLGPPPLRGGPTRTHPHHTPEPPTLRALWVPPIGTHP